MFDKSHLEFGLKDAFPFLEFDVAFPDEYLVCITILWSFGFQYQLELTWVPDRVGEAPKKLEFLDAARQHVEHIHSHVYRSARGIFN
jgi:hypothetical protein